MLVMSKGLTKEGGVPFFDFPPNKLVFFHQKIYIPTPHTHNILSIIPCKNHALIAPAREAPGRRRWRRPGANLAARAPWHRHQAGFE